MRQRLTALALAALLLWGLAACGPQESAPTQAPSEPTATQAPVTPDPTPDATDPSGEVETTAQPTESAQPSEEAPGAKPTSEPVTDPTAAPTEAPSEEPTEEPAQDVTAAALREMFMASSNQSDAPTAGFSNMADYLENFYNLSTGDLDDFVFYMPEMSTALQEFFLARAKEGKVDAVKAACQSRLEGLREEAAFYPGTADFADTAKVEVVGNWVLLAVCPEAERMAKILGDTVN